MSCVFSLLVPALAYFQLVDWTEHKELTDVLSDLELSLLHVFLELNTLRLDLPVSSDWA